MPNRDGKQSSDTSGHSRSLPQAEEGAGIVPPRCIANGAYKCWHPSIEEKAPPATPEASLERRGHASWFARLRFSFFHR
jgi:hypothetical protein